MNNDFSCTIYFDGATRPTNPGQCACGVVVDMCSGDSITFSQTLGWQTNNFAEYSGLILGCKKALELGCERVLFKGDSQLVVEQINNLLPVKSDNLEPLYEQATSLLKQFNFFKIEWIPRNQNERADAVAGLALPKLQHPTLLLGNLPLNLPTVTPISTLKDKILKLIAKGEDAQLYDYLSLKSGTDEFTSKRLPTLLKLIPDQIKEAIASQLKEGEDEKFLCICYRWYLRGLPVQFALRKARVYKEQQDSFYEQSNVTHTPVENSQTELIDCYCINCGREWRELFKKSECRVACQDCDSNHILQEKALEKKDI